MYIGKSDAFPRRHPFMKGPHYATADDMRENAPGRRVVLPDLSHTMGSWGNVARLRTGRNPDRN